MKRSSLLLLVLICAIASCAQAQQSPVLLPPGFEECKATYKARPAESSESLATIGEVQAAYKKVGTKYVTPVGKTKDLVEEVIYFVRKGNTVLVLGTVTKDGAFDSQGAMIKNFRDLVDGQIYGISGNIARTPFSPALVVLAGKTTWETEPVISVGIDATMRTIYEYKPPLR